MRFRRIAMVAGFAVLSGNVGPNVESGHAADVQPLVRAHAHNDYHHERPLLDALSHGFCNVEADIFLVGDELQVGHDRRELKPGRTLQALYLEPLRERVARNGGRVYRDGPVFTLLIDFKTAGPATYAVLREVLADYADMLSSVEEGQFYERAINVVISGNRPFKDVEAESVRYAGLDGRLSNLDSDAAAHLLPMISDRWGTHFRWRGVGPIKPEERAKLREIVEKSHAAGRRVRFWATPEKVEVWEELLAAEVDLINTDDLAGLQRFLQANSER